VKFPLCCSKRCSAQNKQGVTLNTKKAKVDSVFKNGYVYRPQEKGRAKKLHIILAEKALGRPLQKSECVHHINFDRSDNRPSNLLICTQKYHAWLHQEMGRRWALEHLAG
jgi:HNH endonuclease